MRTFFLRLSVVAILGLLGSAIALSGGYQLNEHGARAVGLGGAFVAQASDPSAIYFNPAGLAFQQGINVYAGGTFVMPSNTYKSPTGKETSADAQVFFPPSVYGTYAINSDLVVGLGVFTPYGLGTKWPTSWDGQLLAVETTIKTFYINPTIAYKINDQLSVGLGISYIYGSVDLSKRVSLTMSSVPATSDGTLSMSGTGNGWGINLGVLYKPMDKLSIGVSYRSLTRLDFSGNASFSNMATAAALFPGGTGTATLPLPTNIYVGAAYQVLPELTVEADLQYVGWSAFDNLTVVLPDGPNHPLYHVPLQVSQTFPKHWEDAYIGRVGGEYRMNSEITLRAGVIYDITPQPKSTMEPMLPDADRIDISIGGGYKITNNLNVDAAYMIVLFSDRSTTASGAYTNARSLAPTPITLNGTYSSVANVLSINFGYSF